MAASPAMTMLRSMVAASAIHDGKRGEEDYTDVCHPGTREDYLADLKAWAEKAPADMRVQWANAIAGAGKTAMLRTFCTLLEEHGSFPPISFFFWKNDVVRNTLDRFPATVAAQLCRRIPALVPYVEKAINEDSFLLQSAFKKQMDKLVIGPLLDACDAIQGEQHLIFVIEGLDELDAKGQTVFLNFIPYFFSRLSSLPISLLVSSRPEDMIVGAFQHPKLASISRATRLGASDEDILTFLNDKFDDINLRFPYLQLIHGGKWPSDKKRAIMVRQSSGLFIWPTVAIGHIDKVEKGLRHNERLEQVLSSADPKPWIASPLDNLYRAILEANAPEDPEEFLCFKQQLAYLCLPVGLNTFVFENPFNMSPVCNWSATPVRAVFDETLEELWASVASLSSLFSPRVPLSRDESPTPGISHRSFRDFAFNRTRSGDKLYYASERELHAEVVCKFLKFFNTRQAYQSFAEMSANFIDLAGDFLESHLQEAAVSEQLGRCMDDVMLDYIPPTWPLVAQMHLIVKLFNRLYSLANNPDFPDGLQRREAFLSKATVFFKSRIGVAEEWDAALFRLAASRADFAYDHNSVHSVQCWHVHRSPQCACVDTYIRNSHIDIYQGVLGNSTLFQHVKSRLVADVQADVVRDSLEVLQFFLCLSETTPRATRLSSFIPVESDYWIRILLQNCPPNHDLYNSLGRICAAPLPDLPTRKGDASWQLVERFLLQTRSFDEYTKLCRKFGIETNFPPIKIPDDWWEDEGTKYRLLGQYKSLTVRSSASQRVGSPMATPESDSEDVSSHVSSLSDFHPPSPSPYKPPSIASDFDVEDARQATSPLVPPSESPHVEPIPLPGTLLIEEAVVSQFTSLPASEVEDTQWAATLTVTTSQLIAHAVPNPDSASAEYTTMSGTNRSVPEAVTRPVGQHRRGRVRAFFKKLVRRP